MIDPADYKAMRGYLDAVWHRDPSDREAIEGLMKVLDDANSRRAFVQHDAEVLELKGQVRAEQRLCFDQLMEITDLKAEVARLQGVGARYADALMREKAKGAA